MAVPATFDTLIGKVRQKCHYPPYQKLPDSSIASTLRDWIDTLVTELNLSNQLWLVRQLLLSVSPAQDYIPINAPDFGRVITVETWNDADPNFNTRSIDVVDEPQLVQYFNGHDPGPDGILHSAQAVSFLDDPQSPGQKAACFGPKPGMSATYLILYEPLTARPENLTDQAFPLPQFEGYLTDLAALESLAYCEWPAEKFQQISNGLEMKIQRGDSRFNRSRRSAKQTNNFRTIPFGRSRWQGGPVKG